MKLFTSVKVVKLSILFAFVALVVEARVLEVNHENQVISSASKQLILSAFTSADYESISLILSTSNSSKFNKSDLANEILKGIDTSLRAIVYGHDRKFQKILNSPSPMILLIDSIDAFSAAKTKLNGTFPKYLLIILVKGRFKELDEVVKDVNKAFLYNVIFLESNATHASAYTYFPFKKGKCGSDLSLSLVNSFDIAAGKWNKNIFYPDKFANLHNCTLNIGASEKVPMVMVQNDTKGISFDGAEVLLVKTLAADFNFNLKFQVYDGSSPMRKAIASRKIDIGISGSSLQTERIEYMSPTNMFFSTNIVIVYPPPPYVTSFAKLFLPFDLPMWILIVCIFLVGYGIIIASRFFVPRVYGLIVGHDINFPFTNMLIAFFGQSQSKVPKENFARFLLAIFLIFCLVIRTVYQGILFDFMRKEIFENMPTTIEDLVAKNYTFYTYESLSKRVLEFKFAKNVIVITNAEIEHYRHKTLDSSFKGVVFCYEPQVLYMNYINRNSYTYLILKEKFVTNIMVFYLQAHHFMSENINTRIDWYREFGLTNYMLSKYIDYHSMQQTKAEDMNNPLNLQELEAIFLIWIAGLGISAVVFIIEKMVTLINPRNLSNENINL